MWLTAVGKTLTREDSGENGREVGVSTYKQHFIFTLQLVYEYLTSTLSKNSPYQVIFIKKITLWGVVVGGGETQVREIKRYKLSVMKF